MTRIWLSRLPSARMTDTAVSDLTQGARRRVPTNMEALT